MFIAIKERTLGTLKRRCLEQRFNREMQYKISQKAKEMKTRALPLVLCTQGSPCGSPAVQLALRYCRL